MKQLSSYLLTSRYAVTLLLLLSLGVGNVWGDAPTLEDLSFPTPAVSANFNALPTKTTSNTTGSAVTNNSLTGFTPFTASYLGKNTNGTQSISIFAGDNNPMTSNYFSMATTTNGSCVTFPYTNAVGTGALSFKIAKSSKATIGLYKTTADGGFSHGNAAVWLQFDGGSNIKWSMGTNTGTPSGWQTVTSSLPSTDILDITVIYNNTDSPTTYGGSISLGAKTAHVYVNGTCIMNGENPKACSLYGNTIAFFRVFNNNASTVKVDDIVLYSSLPTAAVGCANTVALSNGTVTNGSLSLGKTSVATCSATAADRQVTITVTPSTGYAAPATLTFTKTSGTATASKVSGPTGSGPYTYVYQFAQNDKGAGTFGVVCTPRQYTVTLDNQGATTAGTTSVTVTYNANTNLTSAITTPTKTGYDFGGYYTMASGYGTQFIDEDGNWLASRASYIDGSKRWIATSGLELLAKWTAKSYSVTWKVNGSNYSVGSPSSTVNHGSRVSKLPTAPNPASYCGDTFVGWTTDAEYVHGTSPLFTTADTAPVASGAQTFYAVFADYDE